MIHQVLERTFHPEFLDIKNDSDRHANHKQASLHGGGHFRLTIRCPALKNTSRIEAHRHIHRALDDLFKKGLIHALSINIL